MQIFEDRIGSGDPLEGLEVRVVGCDEVINALHELLDAGERAATYGLVGDQREEALNLIEPRAVGRNEVHVPALPSGQPSLDLRATVSGEVVGDAQWMSHSAGTALSISRRNERNPWWRWRGLHAASTAPLSTLSAARTRWSSRGACSRGCPLDIAQPHRQHRLRALQRLALALLVHTNHQRVVGRGQVRAND